MFAGPGPTRRGYIVPGLTGALLEGRKIHALSSSCSDT